MMERSHIPLLTQLAATLLKLGDVPYEHAKLMTAAQMKSLYHFHHNKRHAEDGGDHFSNLEPMLIAPHRERTAKIDNPEIAKGKRIRRKQAEFDARQMFPKSLKLIEDALVEFAPRAKRKSRWPQGRKIPSRPFPKRVERRS